MLNEEGHLISADAAKGSWVSDSSTSEVYIPIMTLNSFPLLRLLYYFLYIMTSAV